MIPVWFTLPLRVLLVILLLPSFFVPSWTPCILSGVFNLSMGDSRKLLGESDPGFHPPGQVSSWGRGVVGDILLYGAFFRVITH